MVLASPHFLACLLQVISFHLALLEQWGELPSQHTFAHGVVRACPEVLVVPVHFIEVTSLGQLVCSICLSELSNLVNFEVFHSAKGVDFFSELLFDHLCLVGVIQNE